MGSGSFVKMGKEWSFRSPGRAVDPLKLLQELFCKTGIFRIGPVSEPWEIYPVFPENLSAVPAHEDDPVGQIDRSSTLWVTKRIVFLCFSQMFKSSFWRTIRV